LVNLYKVFTGRGFGFKQALKKPLNGLFKYKTLNYRGRRLSLVSSKRDIPFFSQFVTDSLFVQELHQGRDGGKMPRPL
jgi:hypothetical protein